MKFIVDEMPTKKDDCPLQIHSNDNYFPSVCSLKLNERNLRTGITFSMNQYTNCDVCVGSECQFLKCQ